MNGCIDGSMGMDERKDQWDGRVNRMSGWTDGRMD